MDNEMVYILWTDPVAGILFPEIKIIGVFSSPETALLCAQELFPRTKELRWVPRDWVKKFAAYTLYNGNEPNGMALFGMPLDKAVNV